ncbi:acetamidase [Kineococcus sp. R8]|nr:acetamidase/formamidase family protein [Kineococcus siccus]NAZ80307.1 acetamidase [Kineococcus siccus]
MHRLEPARDLVTDAFDPGLAPVLTVDPGDELLVRTLDAAGHVRRQEFPGQRAERLLPAAGGHCLAGPVAVRGAQPGDVVAVQLLSLRPDDWGWTVAGARDTPLNRRLATTEEVWLLWDVDADAGTARNQFGLLVDTAPFLGVVGTTPAEPGRHSTVPPRPGTGGNVDCRALVAGSTLHLPVQVPGALLCLGDGHAAQGDGEVGGTALECGMTTRLRVDLVREPPVPGVHATTPSERITFGFGTDLNAATEDALDAMVTWIAADLGVGRSTALALASPTVDLRITQVANETWGVHAVLAHDALRRR